MRAGPPARCGYCFSRTRIWRKDTYRIGRCGGRVSVGGALADTRIYETPQTYSAMHARAAKTASGREKDAHDVAEIDRMGFDPDRFARVAESYASMRIECVAHGE